MLSFIALFAVRKFPGASFFSAQFFAVFFCFIIVTLFLFVCLSEFATSPMTTHKTRWQKRGRQKPSAVEKAVEQQVTSPSGRCAAG